MRVIDRGAQSIGYHLNFLGVRVRRDECVLVSRATNGTWVPIGRARSVPLLVPAEQRDTATDPLLLTVYQYCQQHPESDLCAVLTGAKRFEIAVDDAELAA